MSVGDLQAEFNRAFALHKANNLLGARKIYCKLYKINKHSPDLNHLLGLLEHQLGNHDRGLRLIGRAVRSNDKQPIYVHNLGVVYKTVGRKRDAETAFKKAIALKPDYADAYNSLGSLYLDLGQSDEAIHAFQDAVRLDPHHADAKYNLARSLVARRDYGQAAILYRQVLLQRPADLEVMERLATVLKLGGHRTQALEVLEKALSIAPNTVSIHQQLAEDCEAINRLPEAHRHVEFVLAKEPDHVDACYLKAVLLRREGRVEEAIELLSSTPVPPGSGGSAQKIHFELGRLYDRHNEPGKAFHYFCKANKLQSASLEMQEVDKLRYLNRVIDTKEQCTPEWYASWTNCADELHHCELPVFLVAFPRSGTTLLDQILDSHPSVQVLEEKPLLSAVIRKIDASEIKYPAALPVLTADEIEELRSVYFDEVAKHTVRKSGTVLIDKMPFNIVEIQLIHRLFPDSKILLVLRHPYDVCLSNFMQHYSLNDAMANFLSLEDAATLYHEVFTLWEKYLEVLPIKPHAVKYEDLVDNLEAEIRNILSFLGLTWDQSVLDYTSHAKSREIIDTPSYQQVTEPIYNRARYRWERYERYIEPIRDLLQVHVENFGYQARCGN